MALAPGSRDAVVCGFLVSRHAMQAVLLMASEPNTDKEAVANSGIDL